jgi:hypothetical protein
MMPKAPVKGGSLFFARFPWQADPDNKVDRNLSELIGNDIVPHLMDDGVGLAITA